MSVALSSCLGPQTKYKGGEVSRDQRSSPCFLAHHDVTKFLHCAVLPTVTEPSDTAGQMASSLAIYPGYLCPCDGNLISTQPPPPAT